MFSCHTAIKERADSTMKILNQILWRKLNKFATKWLFTIFVRDGGFLSELIGIRETRVQPFGQCERLKISFQNTSGFLSVDRPAVSPPKWSLVVVLFCWVNLTQQHCVAPDKPNTSTYENTTWCRVSRFPFNMKVSKVFNQLISFMNVRSEPLWLCMPSCIETVDPALTLDWHHTSCGHKISGSYRAIFWIKIWMILLGSLDSSWPDLCRKQSNFLNKNLNDLVREFRF